MIVSRKIQFKKFEKKKSQINSNFELFSPGVKLFYLHWAGQQRFSLNSGLLLLSFNRMVQPFVWVTEVSAV